MKTNNSHKIRLGLFTVITGMILVVALYFIGKKQNIFGNTFHISAVFNNVNGLKLGNNVRFSGINVGTVRKITMINDSTICVDMAMEETILPHIRKNAKASIGSDGLVGNMVVNIHPVKSIAKLLEPGDTLGSIRKVSTDDMMSTLSITNENAADLTQKLVKIIDSVQTGQGVLGLLVNDASMGADLKQTLLNLKVASNEASELLSETKGLIKSVDDQENLLHVLLKDTIASEQFKSILSNLEESSYQINSAMTNLNEITEEMNNGEGTFNYLVRDTVLVRDIDEIVKNIKEGSVMLNENLEALRHNTFFKGYFKKQEKQRQKEEKNQAKKN